MPGKISILCPGCDSKLNLPDSQLGKKIKCPKCSEIFVAEAPDDLDDDQVDILSDMEDDEDDVDEPPRKSNAPRGGKPAGKAAPAKGSSKKGGMSPVVMIGGGVALVAVIGGVAFTMMSGGAPKNNAPVANVPAAAEPVTAAAGTATPAAPPTTNPTAAPAQTPPAAPATTAAADPPAPAASTAALPSIPKSNPATQLSPTEKALSLRWMTSDTELIMHLKVAEIWKAPLLAGLINMPQTAQSVEMLKSSFGLEPTDIESVTAGYADVTEEIAKASSFAMSMGAGGIAPGQMPPTMPTTSNQRCVIIVKMKKPVDLAKVATDFPGVTTKDSGGKTVYQIAALPGSNQSFNWWSPDSKTIILGTEKDLLATVERGETIIPRKEFGAINAAPQLVISGVIPKLDSNPKLTDLESNPTFAQFRAAVLPYSLQMVSIGLSVKGGIDLQVITASNTDEGSKKVRHDIEAHLTEGRKMFDGVKATLPPVITELGETVLKNLKVEERSRVVTVATNIPNSAQDKLEQLPPILMVMGMTGGLGGPGGPGMASVITDIPRGPGESPSVAPTTSEGVPDGMTLTAKTMWSLIPGISEDRKPVPRIDIVVDLTGPDLEKICAHTGMTTKPIKLKGGETLRKGKIPAADKSLSETSFRPFEAKEMVLLDHPPGVMRMHLTVDVPKGEATIIDVLEGSFSFMKAEEVKPITIDDATKTAKRPLTAPEFKDPELKLRISHSSVHPATLSVTAGKEYFVGKVKAEDMFSVTESENDHVWQRVYATAKDGEFPEELQLTFNLYSKVTENQITFRFENLSLPSPHERPNYENKPLQNMQDEDDGPQGGLRGIRIRNRDKIDDKGPNKRPSNADDI